MTVKTFISRPLLSLVISVFIVLLGVISLPSLPVERYPDIAPPASTCGRAIRARVPKRCRRAW